jgi:ribosomal protein L12E/L44/L45/RPP1/RPP2
LAAYLLGPVEPWCHNKENDEEDSMKRDWVPHALVKVWLLVLVLGLASCSKGPTDDEISKSIQASYYADPQVKDEKIAIDVKNGEVTLSGNVSSDSARLDAYKLATQTAGVKKVNDQMQAAAMAQPAPAAAPAPETAQAEAPKEEAKAEAKTEEAPPQPPPPPPPRQVTVPAGTSIRVQTIDAISSKTSQAGQTYRASLAAPIVVGDSVVVPKGADVAIKVAQAKSAGKIKGSSELTLALAALSYHGKSYSLASNAVQQVGKSRGKQTATRAGVGAGIGALVGGLAGGGKGAAIGLGVGGGGAMAYQALTHGQEVNVPSETLLDFTLAQPVTITLPPKKTASGGQ